jgi:hypothetical protein
MESLLRKNRARIDNKIRRIRAITKHLDKILRFALVLLGYNTIVSEFAPLAAAESFTRKVSRVTPSFIGDCISVCTSAAAGLANLVATSLGRQPTNPILTDDRGATNPIRTDDRGGEKKNGTRELHGFTLYESRKRAFRVREWRQPCQCIGPV